MELSVNDLELEKKIQINILDIIEQICRQYDLQYWAAYGTMLGAVRHHGMIPWDDDIDIMMPRADYNKLISGDVLLPEPYTVMDLKMNGYPLAFAKIVNMNTSVWEFDNIPFMMGVYIDIFPIDEITDDRGVSDRIKKDFDLSYYRYDRSIRHWRIPHYKKAISDFRLLNLWAMIKDKLYYNRLSKKFKKDLLIQLELSANRQGDKYVSICCPYKGKEIYEKKWFDSYVNMPFESTTIRVPVGYHDYLKHLYGDYMTPPPIDKRVSHHYKCFYDFNKRVSIEDAISNFDWENICF